MSLRKGAFVLLTGAAIAALPVSAAFASHTVNNYHYGSRTGCSVGGVTTCSASVTLRVYSSPTADCLGSAGAYTSCTIHVYCNGSSTSSLAGTGALSCTGASGSTCTITGATGGTCYNPSSGTRSGTVAIARGACLYITATESTTNALGTTVPPATATAHVCVDPTGPDDF